MNDVKSQLLERLEKARARLNSALDQLDQQREIYPGWTSKQFLDHIAGWDDAVIASLKAHSRGDVPAVPAGRGIDPYNAETVTTRETIPLERTRQEYAKTREILIETIKTMPDDKFAARLIEPWGPTASVTEMINVFIHHEHEHAAEIEALLKK